jgi:hypothetical protein
MIIVFMIFSIPSIWGFSLVLESYGMIPKGWWRLSRYKWYRSLHKEGWYFDGRRSVYHDNIYPRWRRMRKENLK